MPFPRLPPHAHIRLAKAALKAGGVIAYATESCFGLGCLPQHPKALKRLLCLKKRPNHKGMITVGAHFQQLRSLLAPSINSSQRYIQQYWPGHYTLLFMASRKVLPWLRGLGQERVALRITANPHTAGICRALGTALVSTSANIAKHHTLKHAIACKKQFGKRVLVLSGNIGKHRLPSTIIDTISGKVLR